jgi:hypothetical protein
MHRWAKLLYFSVVFVGLIVAPACKSSKRAEKGEGDSGSASASDDSAAHIDILCVGERINNPPEPFHYSYKYSGSSGSIDNEADITQQAMEITRKDNSGSHSYHGVRSDENSWNTAVLDLSGLRFTGLSARLDSLNGTSALVRQGEESVNGYSTAKYAIDTTRANSSDRQQFETLFGKGSFEKGTIWVPADGCAVKLALDEAIVQNDGTVDKGHYDLAFIKR